MEQNASKKPNYYSCIGIILGLIAITSAFLSPWVQEQIDPPAKPIEEVAVDMASRLADVAKAKVKGDEYVPIYQRSEKPSQYLVPSVIMAGMLATGLGVLGAFRSEDKFFCGGAIILGVSAAVVQWSLVLLGPLFLILLILAVISFIVG